MRNKGELSQGGEEYHTYNKNQESYWIGHILRRNCCLKQYIKGEVEVKVGVKGRRGRRCKQLGGDLRKKKVTVN